jgi:YD repeat-containing protein
LGTACIANISCLNIGQLAVGLGDLRMESQGNDVVDAGARKVVWRDTKRIVALARVFLCCTLLFLLGVANATTYVYDANGRVVAVTQTTGASAQYTYDALGNIVQVGQVAAGQLAIFAFTPSHGSAGTAVTISGQGFSATAASNALKFNGTAATISSATTTQLIAKVPAGASSGAISVTVGGKTVTSATPFVVDDTGAPPTISQVSPTIVAVGSTVTVTGTHLDPPTGTTKALLAGVQAAVASNQCRQRLRAGANAIRAGPERFADSCSAQRHNAGAGHQPQRRFGRRCGCQYQYCTGWSNGGAVVSRYVRDLAEFASQCHHHQR